VEKNVDRIGVGLLHVETGCVIQDASFDEIISRSIIIPSTHPSDAYFVERGGISDAKESSAAGNSGS
jgi:hypothetical protein